MIKGIDISSWQGNPNFDQVKQAVQFVISKATEGVGFKDPKFDRNRDESRRVGIARGFYHFARPDLGNSPEAEAHWFCEVVSDLDENELLVLDFEPSWNVAGDLKVQWCHRFLDAVSNKFGGYKPLIYLNLSQVRGMNWSSVIAGNYGLWLASWDNNATAGSPATPWPVVAMRQYTNAAQIPGINGNVDGNVFYGDLATLYKYGYHRQQPQPQPQPQPEPQPQPQPQPEPTPKDRWQVSVFHVGGEKQDVYLGEDAGVALRTYNNLDLEPEEVKTVAKNGEELDRYVEPKTQPLPEPDPVTPDPIVVPPVVVPDPIEIPWWKKYTERKFLVAVLLPLLTILARIFGWNLDIDATVNDIISLITMLAPVVWVVVEGQLDKERIKGANANAKQVITNQG